MFQALDVWFSWVEAEDSAWAMTMNCTRVSLEGANLANQCVTMDCCSVLRPTAGVFAKLDNLLPAMRASPSDGLCMLYECNAFAGAKVKIRFTHQYLMTQTLTVQYS